VSGFNRGFDVVGDLALTSDGRDIQLVWGAKKVLQRIRTRAQIFKGSWRYDRQLGMPYFQEILVAGANLELVRRRFQEMLIGTAGVTTIQALTLRIDRSSGTLLVEFSVVCDSGELISDTLDFEAVQ
jgi:hypothetical protein